MPRHGPPPPVPWTNMVMLQTKISDLVQIAPEDFSKHSIVAIEDNINTKYSNKVGLPLHGPPACTCHVD